MKKPVIILLFITLIPIAAGATYALYRAGRAAEATERAALAVEKIAIAAEPKITATLDHVQSAASSLQASADQQREILSRPRVQRSIMLLAQSGDDINRGVKKLNSILDLVDQSSLPRIDALLDSTRETVDSTNVAVSTISAQSAAMVTGMDGMISDIRSRIQDPNITRLIIASTNLTEAGTETLTGLNASREEITEAHVELMGKLGSAVDQYGRLGSEGADFVHGLNKPVTRKQKIMRALITAAAIAAPYAVRR